MFVVRDTEGTLKPEDLCIRSVQCFCENMIGNTEKREKRMKKNVIIDNNKNRTFTIVVWICKILLLFVWLVFSFWWFRLSKLKLDAIFICLKIDLGCQPKQSYLIARIHIIHLSRSRAFISIILILNTRKYSFKITLYH